MKKLFIFITIFVWALAGNLFINLKVFAADSFIGSVSTDSSVRSSSLDSLNNHSLLSLFAEPSSPDSPAESPLPDFYIKSVNPGYTVDGKSNVGEMIELGRTSSDTSLSLAGFILSYTNSSGKEVALLDLSKYTWTTGETILLRLASSPDSELANLTYKSTLAMKAGPLVLSKDGEVYDSVCWTGKDACLSAFSSTSPTTLVRDSLIGEFRHVSEYTPDYKAENLKLTEDSSSPKTSEDEVMESVSKCKGIEFSELLSYYESLQSEQFIELYNRSSESIVLDGCMIKYKNKSYNLSGMVSPEGYFVYNPNEFKLTKNPGTSNVLELIDADGSVLDKIEYFNGQKKGTSFAFIGYDEKGKEIWRTTYSPTPGEPNSFQEFRTCEAGKVINEATGNCVKVTPVAEKICGEGQYLNILTGRCKKYPTESAATECKEGYYYYAETGRCRKIQDNTGADYALVPETYEESSSFVALYLVLGVLALGAVYVIYEFRSDLARLFRRLFRK